MYFQALFKGGQKPFVHRGFEKLSGLNLVGNALNLVENALKRRFEVKLEKSLQAYYREVNQSIAGNMERCNFASPQLEWVFLSDNL